MPDFNISGAGPGKPSGAYTNTDHVGHLVAYVGATEEERVSSLNKDKYLVAHCTFVVCLTERKAWDDTDVSGKVLAPRILTGEGEIVAVRLITGEPKPGQSAPVLPEEPLPVEIDDVAAAFAKYGARLPSGRVIFDVLQYNADNPPPAETPLG
jgi:hypothetical protein